MKNIRNALGTIVALVLSIIQVAEAKPKKILPCLSIPKACIGAISKVMVIQLH
ncbi:MAG: hypothetical protein QF616_02875 [Candidatus Marinimicrobia bacterium]|nr:hypothetical protein [Candidatus Neomarinimicrobiota bacterium]